MLKIYLLHQMEHFQQVKLLKKMKRLEEMTYALVEVVKNIKTVVEDNLGGLNVKVTRV
ncbi:hypothetical protein BN1095_210036 [Clostridioides difficile]|uniref:Uncharacterized protein n=3 Tax=Clostridioides difficile TaxID=1496 RepID=A0A069AKQ5_CLODI|nr:hypothetical protein BN171_140023 [Clostridioides difficile E25]CCL52337.1 hypothetical protein BN180_110036 [Clostridioides difficile E14]CCL75670.1 hypothetical protein BN186_120035 [Clostridioides difficile E23]CCL79101.1 hypothetical protein BN187_120035 [Clostridioides difficile E12]CDS97206.1 hypothetical protein BN1095_210036 [Clostridioides difficile]